MRCREGRHGPARPHGPGPVLPDHRQRQEHREEAQLFDGSSQKAYAADGTEYSADGEAALYANKKAETFLNEINPGNQVTGVVVFDIPKKVKLTKLELHDSPFSGGVAVALG